MIALWSTLALAGTELLADGGFDGGQGGWTTGMGAQTGSSGRTSSVTWPEGGRTGLALKLSGDASTDTWQMAQSATVAVSPGQTLHLSGWIRPEGVRREGRQYDNCWLGLSFVDASGQIVRVAQGPAAVAATCDGTSPWSQVERRTTVPEGAAGVRAMVFLSKSGTLWVDDLSLQRAEPPSWVEVNAGRFRYRWLAQAPISTDQQARNDQNLVDCEAALGLTLPHPITFFRYPDNATKGELTGDSGNAHAEGDHTIHTIWPVDRHEMVHLLTRQVGEPGTAVLGEGIAVHLSGAWQSQPIDDWVKRLHREGRLPALADIFDTAAFRAYGDGGMDTYPVSGSFVGFLLRRGSVDEFKKAYAGSGTPAERLERVYGSSLAELEREWHADLGLGARQ